MTAVKQQNTALVKGSCLCGEVTFAISKLQPAIAHCHCSMCRKFHGAAFSTFAEVAITDLIWLSGEHLLKSYCADNQSVRQFCRNCGSSLTFSSRFNREQETIEVAVASFDQHPPLNIRGHIFTDNKVNWFEINDELPQHKSYGE